MHGHNVYLATLLALGVTLFAQVADAQTPSQNDVYGVALEDMPAGMRRLGKIENGWNVLTQNIRTYARPTNSVRLSPQAVSAPICRRTRSIRPRSSTQPDNLPPATTNTFCISTRTRRHAATRSRRSPCTTRTVSRCRTRSIASQSGTATSSLSTPTARSTSTCKRSRRVLTRSRTGCRRRRMLLSSPPCGSIRRDPMWPTALGIHPAFKR
jgi:hypothetical protein